MTEWTKACTNCAGSCVGVRADGDDVLITNTTEGGEAVTPIRYTRHEWDEFLRGAKDGTFDSI